MINIIIDQPRLKPIRMALIDSLQRYNDRIYSDTDALGRPIAREVRDRWKREHAALVAIQEEVLAKAREEGMNLDE
jgi:hypothetical protein